MKRLLLMAAMIFSSLALADFQSDTTPYRPMEGASVYGMKIINSLPSKSGLAKVGVRKGDVVLSWNHRKIADDMSALQAYNEKTVTAAHVIRNGHAQFLKASK